MKVEYQKTQLFFGGFRSNRVVWITLLNGERAVKFNLLDQTGNLLYSIERRADETETIDKITYGTISDEQIEDIQNILARKEPCYEWGADYVDGMLIYFGCQIARLDDWVKHTLECDDVVVDYDIYSSYEEDDEGNEIEELSDLAFYEVGSITRDEIENFLVQKLLAHKEWDTIEMKIIEDGQIESYLLEFEDRDD